MLASRVRSAEEHEMRGVGARPPQIETRHLSDLAAFDALTDALDAPRLTRTMARRIQNALASVVVMVRAGASSASTMQSDGLTYHDGWSAASTLVQIAAAEATAELLRAMASD